jgi:opacity protein-like surface antigen
MFLHQLKKVMIASALVFSSTAAYSEDLGGLYLKAYGGASMLSDTDVSGSVVGSANFETGPVTGGALGYNFGDSPFRAELEWAWRSGEAKTFAGGASGDFASTTALLNGYYDIAEFQSITPYVGFGAGYVTEIDWDVTGGTAPGEYSDRGGLAWQVMTGINYAVSERIGFLAELRYFDAGSRTISGSAGNIKADYASTEGIVGLYFSF